MAPYAYGNPNTLGPPPATMRYSQPGGPPQGYYETPPRVMPTPGMNPTQAYHQQAYIPQNPPPPANGMTVPMHAPQQMGIRSGGHTFSAENATRAETLAQHFAQPLSTATMHLGEGVQGYFQGTLQPRPLVLYGQLEYMKADAEAGAKVMAHVAQTLTDIAHKVHMQQAFQAATALGKYCMQNIEFPDNGEEHLRALVCTVRDYLNGSGALSPIVRQHRAITVQMSITTIMHMLATAAVDAAQMPPSTVL